MSRHRAY